MSATYETTNPAIEATPKDRRGLVLAISALVVLLDRITKHIVAQQLPNGQTFTVIPGIFRISDVHNTGAAFSFLADSASPDLVLKGLIFFSIAAVVIVGIMLLRAHLGRGYGTDAMRLIVGFGFREVGLHRIQLGVYSFNPRAIAAYRKAGFIEEGRRREAIYHDGHWYDNVQMSILEHEWRAGH